MRRIPYTQAGLIVLLCVVLGGCSKKTAETEPAPEAETVATVEETPQPAAPEPAPATPAPVTKRLAPEGTYFLLVKKSAETSDGILGFKPGTLVKKEADGSFTAEGHKLDVKENEVTNDLDLAAQYAGVDAQRQAALRQAAAIAAMTPPPSAQSSSSTTGSSAPPRPGSSSSSGGADYVAATRRTGTGLDSSSSLGAGHTKTQDGWLWQKDAAGYWKRVKPLR